MPGDLRGAESAFNRSGRHAEQHSAQTSFTSVAENRYGSEFAGKLLDRWEYEKGIRIDFSPGLFALPPLPFRQGRKSEARLSGLMRAVLLLNVFLNDFKWRTAHTSSEVRRRPKRVCLPDGLMQIGMMQFHLATADPFQTVNQLADRHSSPQPLPVRSALIWV